MNKCGGLKQWAGAFFLFVQINVNYLQKEMKNICEKKIENPDKKERFIKKVQKKNDYTSKCNRSLTFTLLMTIELPESICIFIAF